jgi:ubiquinone/menaquinone biosynthesis C-methylase UbiE
MKSKNQINMEEITRAKFNTLKKYYDQTWDKENHTLHVGFFLNEQDLLVQAYRQATDHLLDTVNAISPFTTQSVVLDIGCGTGKTLVDICQKFGCHGVGIDISDEQIRDAQVRANSLSHVSVQFLRASGSDLSDVLCESEQFTHIISQDAILLVVDKQALFSDVTRLLVSGGVFAAADFLSEESVQEWTDAEDQLVYRLVNWTNPLSFTTYRKVLEDAGFSGIRSERQDANMIRTYEMLAQEIAPYIVSEDGVYAELKARYESIVCAVRDGKMGWGFFFARKS